MKIHFFYLSLLATSAHARHVPKSLRGHDGLIPELVGEDSGANDVSVPKGSSATITCGSGGTCCITNSNGVSDNGFKCVNISGNMVLGGGGSCHGMTMSGGSLIECKFETCLVTCPGTCNVVVEAGRSAEEECGGDDDEGDWDDDDDDDEDDDDEDDGYYYE